MKRRVIAICSHGDCPEIWWAVDPEKWDGQGHCERCGGIMVLTVFKSNGPGPLWPEGGVTLEHAEANPVHFKSRSDAKNYAKKHNVELGCL